jgi:hypothetical protein
MARTNQDLERIKSHRFRLGRYRLVWRNPNNHADGTCDPPDAKGKKIFIRRTLPPRRLLEVLVDESIHASCWDLDNEVVVEMAERISAFLWRCGYRRVPGGDARARDRGGDVQR